MAMSFREERVELKPRLGWTTRRERNRRGREEQEVGSTRNGDWKHPVGTDERGSLKVSFSILEELLSP